MSTPPSLARSARTRAASFETTRGTLAGIVTEPDGAPRGTALLLPGFTGSKEDFLPILDPLAERGWRVASIDQLGQFESPGPDDEESYSLARLGADAADVIASLGSGPVHLVGHSLGGLVAREAVLLGAPVATLTLLCSGPAALPPHRHGALPALAAVLPHTSLETVWTAKEAMDRDAGWTPPSDEVLSFLRRRFCANNPNALRAKAQVLMSAPDRTAGLAASGVPVRVVYGEADDAWPLDEQRDMAARLGTEPVIIAGAGHSPAVEAPAATAAVLDDAWSRVSPMAGGGTTQP